MAGGVGSRFWPASTDEMPKQFLDILGTGNSLLQQTYQRFEPIVGAKNILILTNAKYKNLVLEQLPSLNSNQVICEPARRNTAPCILYAAYKIWKQDKSASFIVAPSDHIVSKNEVFKSAIELGLSRSKSHTNETITLGIEPSYPATGFGYIKSESELEQGVFKVKAFTEKPEQHKAEEMLKTGGYYWNSGLFIWNAENIVELFKQYQPQMFELFHENDAVFNTDQEQLAVNNFYPKCEDISVDYAILENAENVSVIPGDFGWSDLGSWGSIRDHAYADEHNNIAIGGRKKLFKDSANNITLFPKNKKIIIKGLTDYIIVDTENALLICPAGDEQEIKQYVAELNNQSDQ